MKGVDGGDEPERIEIEVTAHEPRPRPNPEPKPGEPSGDHPHGPTVPPRARVAALVVGVGLGALALGWVLGSAGGDQTAAESPVTTQDASDVSDEPDETARVGETLPPAEIITTTTERPRPTTTTLPAIETTTIEVAPPLREVPLELVGTSLSTLITIDLPSGTMTQRRDVDLPSREGPPMLWAGPGWIIALDWNSDQSILIEGDDRFVVELGSPWQLFESATAGEFWRVDELAMTGLAVPVEPVDRHGEPIGESITVRGVITMADPAGGVVVDNPSGTYSVTPDGATRIVDGALIALDARRALAHRCDELLVCEFVIIDRATGETHPLDLDEEFEPIDGSGFGFGFGRGDLGTIAPGGRSALAMLSGLDGIRIVVIDLDTGAVTRLTAVGGAQPRWSPDGDFVIYLDLGRLMAHEVASGDSFVVADDGPEVLGALAVRPSSTG